MSLQTEESRKEREAFVAGQASLSDFLQTIHPPEMIRSFILKQLDQLDELTQLVCKVSALVGVYFSADIIRSFLRDDDVLESNLQNLKPFLTRLHKKLDEAFKRLIAAGILEPVSF